MILDYNEAKRTFILRVPRGTIEPKTLMEEHGLDFSETGSNSGEAILFTREPYAGAAFYSYATPRAQAQLIGLQTEIDKSWKRESTAHIACPGDQELWPFQRAGVEYALSRHNTLIGDQPGLGKTPMAICLANEMQAERILVLCPANIRLQWVKKIRAWTTMPWPYVVYPILHGRHGVHPKANWTVVSYDLARTEAIGRALAKGWYDLVILDEAHYLKTIDSARTRAVFGGGEDRLFDALQTRADRLLGLTGTPLPNRPREAYTLARGLCFDSIDFMSEDSFSSRFNPSMKRETPEGKIYIDERSGRHGELQARLRSNFMVRREKHGPNGVMSQLKMPVYDIVHIEEDSAVKQALKAESMLGIDPENLEGADAAVLGHIAVVRRMMGVALAPHVADYVEMCLDGGEDKIVVFAHHVEVLDIICGRLAKYGCLRIDGRTSANNKERIVTEFQTNRSMRVVAGNMQSMGTGTDGLQDVCWHAIFGEVDWVPGTNQQGVDRLDRGLQGETVQADFLVAPGSFSERILASALRKNQVTHKALDRVM